MVCLVTGCVSQRRDGRYHDDPIDCKHDTDAVKRPKTFAVFSKLPPEIRLIIWQMADEPRLIAFTPYLDYESATWEIGMQAQPVYTSHACHESRAVALTNYTQIKVGDFSCFYINQSRDTIYFDFVPRNTEPPEAIYDFFTKSLSMAQSLVLRMAWVETPGLLALIRDSSELQNLGFIDETATSITSRDQLRTNVQGLRLEQCHSLNPNISYRGHNGERMRWYQDRLRDLPHIQISVVRCKLCPHINIKQQRFLFRLDRGEALRIGVLWKDVCKVREDEKKTDEKKRM